MPNINNIKDIDSTLTRGTLSKLTMIPTTTQNIKTKVFLYQKIMNAYSDTELPQMNKAQIRTYLQDTINLCVKFTFPTRYGPHRNKTFF